LLGQGLGRLSPQGIDSNFHGLEKVLANLWSRKKITKMAWVGRGRETKWEIPDKFTGCELRLVSCPHFK
jgi:hypothetical protein